MSLTLASTVRFALDNAEIVALEPSITRWQRLEAEIAALDLAPGLEARLADPLWLVGRQWQLAELRGEDAGTPIQVALEGEKVPVRFPTDSPRGGEPLAQHDGLVEPVVEAEEARSGHAALAAQAGLDFERALELHGAQSLADDFRAQFPFAGPADFDPVADRAGARFLALALGRAIDAHALATALRSAIDAAGNVQTLPAGINGGAHTAAALNAATEWLAAWNALLFEPQGSSLWRDERLEYSFALETPHTLGTTTLQAQEYHGGRLDWWTFDLGKTTATGAAAGAAVSVKMLPVPIRFPGMPANRYWECEDGSVNLARPKGGPASISLLLMLEYALVASNDWFHVPLELDYGSAFRLTKLTVTDTFGRIAEVPRASAGASGWALFELTVGGEGAGSPPLFVLPPVAANVLESEPIEEAVMFRDEMANVVWGVERRTVGLTGEPIIRNEPVAESLVLSQQLEELEDVDAATLYRLQSTVALNWYPFVARQDPAAPAGTLLLSRRNLRRISIAADGSVTQHTAQPRGRLLNGQAERFEVVEQEVPRSGLFLTRTMQQARTADGRRVVWLGRQKRVGRGEGRSDLSYDLLEPTTSQRPTD
jgi:hypothetical protein